MVDRVVDKGLHTEKLSWQIGRRTDREKDFAMAYTELEILGGLIERAETEFSDVIGSKVLLALHSHLY